MIIKRDSVLNQLPKEVLTEREIIFLETIIHSIRVIDISYNRLAKQLHENKDDLATELPMIEVWNIIDSSHRLRCIVEKTPGLKKKAIWFQLTVRKLKETEDLRNFIQHYNQEIDNLINNVQPLLGHLSWVEKLNGNEAKIGLIVPGNLRQFEGLELVNPAGKMIRSNIDLVTFYMSKFELNLSNIYFQLIDFIKELEIYIENKSSAQQAIIK